MTSIRLFVTSYGRPASQLLRERVSEAKADDPLSPVAIVVPTNYVGVSTRRLLAGGQLGPITERGSGVAGLTLLTVYRLAELLGAPRLAAAGRRPVSTPVLAAAVRGVLATDPGVFAPVRAHPSTVEELVRVHRELSGLSAESLERLAATSRRAGDVVRIHQQVRERLADAWYEESDLMVAARAALAEGAAGSADLGTVIVYLPQDLSSPAAALIRAVAAVAPVEVVAGRTGFARADGDLERSLRRLDLDLPVAEVAPPAATAVVSVSDAEEEVRSSVERVIAAARDGVALERMAILYPTDEPYARLVHDQLQAAGIRYNGRAVRPLTDRLLGRWLLDLLELPERRYARPAVTGLLAAAPVREPSGRWVPAGAWERISREAGIVLGRREWLDKLARYARQQRAQADHEESSPDVRPWLVERHRRNATQADHLRRFVATLFDELARAERLRSWRELVGWAEHMIRGYLGSEQRRERWPDVERDAADRVEEALDRLEGLDLVEPQTDLRVFRRTLRLELDQDLGRVGEFGQGLLVGTVSAGLGVDLDLVVVLGLAEGVLPTRPREDSLLSDSERRAVAEELKPRADRVHVEHRHLLAALAASRGQRILVYPRGDLRRSIERAPSRWLLDSVEALRDGDGGRVSPRAPETEDPRSLPASAPWLQTVASFAGRIRRVAFPATRQQYALRALLEADTTGHGLPHHPLVAADPVLRLGTELLAGRGSDRFTRFDGNLGLLAGELPCLAAPDRVVSASQLEAYLACPHAYLMQYLLRVEPVENPEELLEIEATEKGALVHDILERWLCELLDAGLPAATEPWPDTARQRLRQIAEEACRDAEERGVTGHALLWRRERQRILLDLQRFADYDDQRRRTLGATPVGAEMAFGVPGAVTGPVTIDLGDGRSLRVRGRIDRVDRTADGAVVVTDYKTGSTSSYLTLTHDTPLGNGAKLQLPIYGLAVRAAHPDSVGVRAEYWFVSTKGEFKRIGYELTKDVVDELRRALRVVVDGIGAGRFPLRPEEPGFRVYVACPYCDPDGLGTADRHRDWERLRALPQLRDYVALVEPDALGEEQT